MTVAVVMMMSLGLPGDMEPAHRANPVFARLLDEGWTVGGSKIAFPQPLLAEGSPADRERSVLESIAGSARAVGDFTRDSVNAPFIFRTRDTKVGDDVIVRQCDLWFVIRAKLDDIDPSKAATESDGKTVEAGNMKFTSRRLPDGADAKKEPMEWRVHAVGDLLDRIHVEATDRIVATRSPGSWVIASWTDPAFDQSNEAPNLWRSLGSTGKAKATTNQTFAGGASYVKISRLETVPGALLIEAHLAFAEPRDWFDGSPILRSKLGLIAQDRIRSLRREVAKKKSQP